MKVGVKASSPIDVAVGLRLRLRRKECGMSQTALADKIGVSFQQVQKYENGNNRIGASRLAAIATCLNVPVSYFFDSNPPAEAKLSQAAFDLVADMKKPDVLELNRAFVAIADPVRRRAVIQLVKAIADG